MVKYSGTLRGDLFEDLERQANTADLCLVMGTSLTGLNADQVAEMPARRSAAGKALGTVIVSPQRTALDGKASLRIYAKADDVMRALAAELGLGSVASIVKGLGALIPKDSRVIVPYDQQGFRSDTVRTYWDLRSGQKVRLGENNNCAGARQPSSEKLTSRDVGEVTGREAARACITICFSGGASMRLGLWWLEAAQRGGVAQLPVVNVSPQEAKAP